MLENYENFFKQKIIFANYDKQYLPSWHTFPNLKKIFVTDNLKSEQGLLLWLY